MSPAGRCPSAAPCFPAVVTQRSECTKLVLSSLCVFLNQHTLQILKFL